jgi:hypothetical protein
MIYAQVETVRAPSDEQVESEFEQNTNLDSQRSYFEAIMTETGSSTSSDTQEQTAEMAGTSTQVQEGGALSSDSGSVRDDNNTLSARVAEINERYEAATANCTTGSWLANLWCRIKWW